MQQFAPGAIMPQIDAGGAVTGCLSKEGLGAEASASSSSPVALAVSEDDALFNAGTSLFT